MLHVTDPLPLLLCQLSMLLTNEVIVTSVRVVEAGSQACCTYLAQGALHVVQDLGCITATQSRLGPGNGVIDGSNGLRGEVGGLVSCCWGWGWGGSWGDCSLGCWGGCSLGCW